jgi:hypothetical protein
MIITKQLEWMRDYIDDVTYLVPRVKYVKRLSSKRGSLDRKQHVQAVIHYVDKKHYRISLYVTYKPRTQDKIKKYTTIELLHNLAHELAHLETFEHTPSRMRLECEIMKVFMARLQREGYVSEEHEEKNGSFY